MSNYLSGSYETVHKQKMPCNCKIFWQTFLEGKPGQVRFHIENMLEYDPVLLSDVIAAIDRPNVDICLDVGHTHCNSKMLVLK